MHKPSISIIKKLGLVIACIAIGAIGWFVASSIRGVEEGKEGQGIGFSIPLVAASEVSSGGHGALSTYAGLSAYMKLSPISDLGMIANAFDSLSFGGEDYVAGTIKVKVGGPFNEGTVEIQIYVDTGGSVVAFQLGSAPSPMGVVHWGSDCGRNEKGCNSPLETTLLQKGLEFAATELGGSAPENPSFYNWQFPEADQVVIMADLVVDGQDDMQIFVPATATVYESTIGGFGGLGRYGYSYNWSEATLTDPSTVTLNDETLKSSADYYWWTLTERLLATDTVHTFSVDSGMYSNNNWNAVAGQAVMVVYSR